MPNIKSAGKRAKQAVTRHARNVSEKARLATLRKKVIAAAEEKDLAATKRSATAYISALDKALKKGIVRKNNVARHKSWAMLKVQALG